MCIPLKKSSLSVLWAVLLGACLYVNVYAQSAETKPDADLEGVTNVRVSFSQLTPDATTCGLSLQQFRPILRNELESTGLVLVAETDVLVTLGLMTTYDRGRDACGTSATLGAYKKVSYFDESVGWLRTGYVVLWQRGQQVMSGIAEHAESMDAVIQKLTEVFSDSWQQANNEDNS